MTSAQRRPLHVDLAGIAEAMELLSNEHEADARVFAREGERVRAAHASGVASGLRTAAKNMRALLRGVTPPIWSASYPTVRTAQRDARRPRRRRRS